MFRSILCLGSLAFSLAAQLVFGADSADPAITRLQYEIVAAQNAGDATQTPATPVLKLMAENIPHDKPVMLIFEKMRDSAPKKVSNLKINEDNEFVFGDDPKKVFTLPLKGFAPGEPMHVILLSADGNEKADVSVVPVPIEVQDNQGRRFSVVLANADGSAFKFVGEGFKPKENLWLRSTTGKKMTRTKLSATDAGRFSGVLKPFDRAKKGGMTKLEISGKEGKMWLEFGWGDADVQQEAEAA